MASSASYQLKKYAKNIAPVTGEKISIRGAREHNLQNVDIDLPRNKLVVLSGLSGSGKSSLAFDTLFAEGQRRYMESLSSYARQFLGTMDKPDVDLIEGLSPAISIEQKSTNKNPRSTVGTITEIYDYYRLLFARIGHAHCPNCGREIAEQSIDQIIDTMMSWPEGTKVQILSPVVRGKKGEHQKVFEDARKAGFARARVDGVMADLEDTVKLDKQKKHTIEIVVDRIIISPSVRKRLADSVETALKSSNGTIIVTKKNDAAGGEASSEAEVFFSQKNACPSCGISIPELQPRLFSFNNPFGACPECTGLGEKMEFDLNLMIPDESKSFDEWAILPYNPSSAWNTARMQGLADAYKFTLSTPIEKLTKKQRDALLYGTKDAIHWEYEKQSGEGYSVYDQAWPGLFDDMKRRYTEAWGDQMKTNLEKYMAHRECAACRGKRLRPEALGVTVGGKNIWEITELSVLDSIDFFDKIRLTNSESEIASQVLKEIRSRLRFLKNVGLDYLTLERAAETLSGGEAQRIRLATQIGSALVGVMYILDEPSIGLHQRDNQKLIDTLTYLRDAGNTVIVVEHDEQTLRTADYLVDLGPAAGVHGGRVMAQGTAQEVARQPQSVTGQFLSGARRIAVPRRRALPACLRDEAGEEAGKEASQQAGGRKAGGQAAKTAKAAQADRGALRIVGARGNNLKGVNVSIPIGLLTCVTGVSGSGKSTLVNETLLAVAAHQLNHAQTEAAPHEAIEGLEHFDKVIAVDQSPIGRTPRSNPATYTGVFSDIRNLFVSLPEAKIRGYKPGRFSFNVSGGRCETCKGNGYKTIEMNFLPDVLVPCEDCHGRRYNRETLEVRYRGKSIADVLDMTINMAVEFFENIPAILSKIKVLQDVGLGYIKLGQPSTTLSGGESQRVKLATELAKRDTGRTLYILDEPTTGLHFEDIRVLLGVLNKLVDKGNTIIVIEHNLDVIKSADYLIDMGPDGGRGGGRILFTGTPEALAAAPRTRSRTAPFLRKELSEG